MKGTVSFHPLSLEFFDDMVQPLLAEKKVNPEPYINDAIRLRETYWRARGYQRALDNILVTATPPSPEPGAGLLKNLRVQLERLDHRVDDLTMRVRQAVDADLHLHGRPFFITEGSATRVAERVDEYRAATGDDVDSIALEQLVHLDAKIAKSVEPAVGQDLGNAPSYRADLLSGLKSLYDIARAARRGDKWGRGIDVRKPALEVLQSELPARAVFLHSRAVPFWIARDVDGLETVCRAAGVPPPGVFVPPWRLFGEACDEFPGIKEALHVELQSPTDVGAFVSPSDIAELLDFLAANGSRIIQVAARHDQGATCTTLLRKVRECATYAERRGMGYLEASGILPPDLEEEQPFSE